MRTLIALAQIGLGWLALGFFGGIIAFFFLLGKLTWGTGADVVDWDPSDRQEQRRSADDDDLHQMLEIANRDRKAQGLPLLTNDNVIEVLGEEHQSDEF